jgi:hypothetical protein
MTKAGFKSVTIPEQLYQVLSLTAKINKISISKVIEQGVLGMKPPSPEAHVLSGLYYEPIPRWKKWAKPRIDATGFARFLKAAKRI